MFNKKPYIKPTIRVTDKDEIQSYAESYLIENEFVVMNDFIHNDMNCPEPHGNTNFIGDIAYKMRNTGKYELKETNNRYVVYKKEKKPFQERYWWAISFVTLAIGWFGDIGKEVFLQKQTPKSQKSEQATPTKPDTSGTKYSDKQGAHTVTGISKMTKDTLAKYKKP